MINVDHVKFSMYDYLKKKIWRFPTGKAISCFQKSPKYHLWKKNYQIYLHEKQHVVVTGLWMLLNTVLN